LLETAEDLVPQLEQKTANKQMMKNNGGFRLMVASPENVCSSAFGRRLSHVTEWITFHYYRLKASYKRVFIVSAASQRDVKAHCYFFSLARQ
ncbi:MAG TPA: hypothetical protein VIC84_01970, partial [Blastocatellia bacterium]